MVLKIKTGPLVAVTWVLIFGGMLMLALGLVVRRTEVELGSWIAGLSIAAIVVGVVLVWVRSRIGEAKP